MFLTLERRREHLSVGEYFKDDDDYLMLLEDVAEQTV